MNDEFDTKLLLTHCVAKSHPHPDTDGKNIDIRIRHEI